MTGKFTSSRYKKSGWFGESYRHYLASKGIKSRKYNAIPSQNGALAKSFGSDRAKNCQQEVFYAKKLVPALGYFDLLDDKFFRYMPDVEDPEDLMEISDVKFNAIKEKVEKEAQKREEIKEDAWEKGQKLGYESPRFKAFKEQVKIEAQRREEQKEQDWEDFI